MNTDMLTEIAQHHLRIETLEERRSDSLDFHEVSIWEVERALRSAYLAGYAAAERVANGSTEEAEPREEHTMIRGVWLGEGPVSEWTDDPEAETVVTLSIPEVELLNCRLTEDFAGQVVIPQSILHRRIG